MAITGSSGCDFCRRIMVSNPSRSCITRSVITRSSGSTWTVESATLPSPPPSIAIHKQPPAPLSPVQDRAHALSECREGERLREKLRTGLRHAADDIFFEVTGEMQDRQIGARFAQAVRQLDTAGIRQHHVRHQQVETTVEAAR